MSIQSDYGYVISQGDNYVVREKIKDGKIIITLHSKENGVEMRPRGYLIGSNRLEFTPHVTPAKG